MDRSGVVSDIGVYRPESRYSTLARSSYSENLFKPLTVPDEVVCIWDIGFQALRVVQAASEDEQPTI
jgi:hypothetical protein